MAKPFKKWHSIIPEIGKRVQVKKEEGGEIFESTVIKRGTIDEKTYYIVLQDGTCLQIDPTESLKKMEQDKTDNGPLWNIWVGKRLGDIGSHLELTNLFILN